MTVQARKRASLPAVPDNVDPSLARFLNAIKERLEVDEGERPGLPIEQKKPTIQDLLAAGVPNANRIR